MKMNGMMNMMKTTKTNMKYLKRFNENESKDYDFYITTYDALDKFVVGAYMIIGESEKTITVLNLIEKQDIKGFYVDNKEPYTFMPFKTILPKSQIEILDSVDNMEGFKWIKIPYWLFKDKPGLKIQRIRRPKRFSNNSTIHTSLKSDMIDDDVRKYLSITDKDPRSIINLGSISK